MRHSIVVGLAGLGWWLTAAPVAAQAPAAPVRSPWYRWSSSGIFAGS